MDKKTDSSEVPRYDPVSEDIKAHAAKTAQPAPTAPKAMPSQAQLLEMQKKLAGEFKKLFDEAEKNSKSFITDLSKKYKKELLGVVIVPPRPKPKNCYTNKTLTS